MQLPFFYTQAFAPGITSIELDEDTSRHVVQVLRMKEEDNLKLTDGKGHLVITSITEANKKHCIVQVEQTVFEPARSRQVAIAISLLKNASRFEWFLEKATEIGVSRIIPLQCERTITEKFRHERLQSICVSAMLQSQQSWLPVLHEPIPYELLFRQEEVQQPGQKFIAHCVPAGKDSLLNAVDRNAAGQLILIGPEGDFTPEEIDLAMQHRFVAVTLGETRLRTETAGIVAATLMCGEV